MLHKIVQLNESYAAAIKITLFNMQQESLDK